MTSIIYPKDFFEQQVKIDPKLCFILSPFKQNYEGIKEAIDFIVRDSGFEPVRADDIRQPGIIHSDIWDHIQRAAVIIADVTEYNPNVFFELGVAATVKDKSRLIIVRQSSTGGEYPFDISTFRYIPYENTIPGSRKLTENLKSFLKNIFREDDAILDISEKMLEWKEIEYEYDLSLKPSDLKRLKKLSWIDALDKEISAYAIASSMYYKCDCKFWTDLNRDNIKVAEPIAYMICGRYAKPAFRAAYALQYMDEKVMVECFKKIEKTRTEDILKRLIKSIQSSKVKEFIKKESGKYIPIADAQKLLTDFKRWDVI